MRRGFVIGLVLLLALAGVAIGVTAYHAGLNHGLDQAANGAGVVHVVGPGYDGFPFGLFLFPLVFIGLFLLVRGAFWGRRWGGPGAPGGPGGPGGHWTAGRCSRTGTETSTTRVRRATPDREMNRPGCSRDLAGWRGGGAQGLPPPRPFVTLGAPDR